MFRKIVVFYTAVFLPEESKGKWFSTALFPDSRPLLWSRGGCLIIPPNGWNLRFEEESGKILWGEEEVAIFKKLEDGNWDLEVLP